MRVSVCQAGGSKFLRLIFPYPSRELYFSLRPARRHLNITIRERDKTVKKKKQRMGNDCSDELLLTLCFRPVLPCEILQS